MPRCGAGSVAGDAVADAVDPAELLDVEVDQLAGPCRAGSGRSPAWGRAPGAGRGGGGAGPGPRWRPGGRACGRWRGRTGAGGAAPGSRPRAASLSRVGLWCGRDERSARPASPSAAWRSRHLRTVLGVTPAAAATRATLQPSARRSDHQASTMRRGSGILVDVHPGLRAGVASLAATAFQLGPGWTTSIATTASQGRSRRRVQSRDL